MTPVSPFLDHQHEIPSPTHPYSSLPTVNEEPLNRAPSPAGTSVSEFLDAYAYLLHENDAPFSNIGPSVMNVPVKPVAQVQAVHDLRRVGSAASIKKGIMRARSPLTVGKGHSGGKGSDGEVIYMTVVKETDA